MNVISKEAAIASLKFIADEIKPSSGFSLAALGKEIAERYEFGKIPTLQETATKGAIFQHGRLVSKKINIAEMGVFNDALTATTTDTNSSVTVVNDLFVFLKKNFGVREPSTKPIRAFTSQLVVEFENNPEKTFKAFDPLIALLQDEQEALNGIKQKIQFNRIDFASDPTQGAATNAVFLIERRAGVPYATNRYFCKAYLPTGAHIRALELLDKILGSKS